MYQHLILYVFNCFEDMWKGIGIFDISTEMAMVVGSLPRETSQAVHLQTD